MLFLNLLTNDFLDFWEKNCFYTFDFYTFESVFFKSVEIESVVVSAPAHPL